MTIPHPEAPVRVLHPYDVPAALEVYAEWTRWQCRKWQIDPDALERCQRHLQRITAVSDPVQRARTFLAMQSRLQELTAAFAQVHADHDKDIIPVPEIFYTVGEIAGLVGETLVVLDADDPRRDAGDQYTHARQMLHTRTGASRSVSCTSMHSIIPSAIPKNGGARTQIAARSPEESPSGSTPPLFDRWRRLSS